MYWINLKSAVSLRKARSPKTSSNIINPLLIRLKNARPDRTLNVLPATADAPSYRPITQEAEGEYV
ncbi:MAG: hypothetical protein LH628_24795 [Microcoleus sp. CAN_BIN18]|nr:hypothetical protein [Microcoleus sp. CAN_BIN18]